MFCGPTMFCADRRCELCRSMRRSAILFFVGAFGLASVVTLAVIALVGCGPELGARPCDVVQHIDTTGNVRTCACVCEEHPEHQCPMLADGSRHVDVDPERAYAHAVLAVL